MSVNATDATDATGGAPNANGLRATLLAAGLGAFGILSGGALFVLLLHEGEHLPYAFLIALAVAAVVSFGIESVRELVKHGSLGKETFSPPRMVVTILTLMTFELFVAAWHALPGVWGKLADEFPTAVLGPRIAESAGAGGHFIALGALWVVVGAALAAMLSLRLGDDEGANARAATVGGASFGAVCGLVIAPVAVFAFLLLARTVGVLWQMVFDHDAWRSAIEAVAKFPFPPVKAAAVGVLWLDDVLPVDFLWPLVSLAIGIALLVKNRWLFAVAVIVFVFPYLEDWKNLLVMLGLVALVFGVPGAVLGGLTPWLKRPASAPAAWGSVAFLVAALLVALTALRLAGPWFLLPAAMLVATGFLVRSSDKPEEWWPLLALAVGLFVFGMNSLVVEATFRGVFVKFPGLLRAASPAIAATPGPPDRTPVGRARPSDDPTSLDNFITLSQLSKALANPAARLERQRVKAMELPLPEREVELERLLADCDEKLRFSRAFADSPEPEGGRLVTSNHDRAQWKEEADQLEKEKPVIESSLAETLLAIEKERAEAARLAAQESEWESHRQDRQFELCITGSFGFWVAVALMAGFAMVSRGRSHAA